MFLERDLARLVIQLNPYAIPPSMILAAPPTPALARFRDAAVYVAANVTALDKGVPTDFSVFTFETQDNPAYAMDWRWFFKGHERIIRRALRFEYRYPVLNGGGALATEHLLIGYEGGAGP